MLVFIAGLSITSGCKKSSSTSYTMHAVINGKLFSGTRCFATANNTAVNIYGDLSTNASSTTPTFPYLLLSISNFSGTGTYYIGTTGVTGAGATIDSSSSHNVIGYAGTIVIGSTSPNITGSFTFTTLDSTNVINGSFTALAP